MIIVTGATGFIGSYVHRQLLLDGHDVVGVSRYPPRPETEFVLGPLRPRYEIAELRDPAMLRRIFTRYRPDVVLHLDAYVNPAALRLDPSQALEYNFIETIDVLEQARAANVRRVVFASSIAVLPSILHEPINATHPIITAREGPGGGFYGAAKAAAEAFGLQYPHAFGMDFRAVRPSAVYGFGMQWPIEVKPVIEGLVAGKTVTINAAAPPRDFTFVLDVARIFVAVAMCPDEADRVFYAATGETLTTPQDLCNVAKELFPGSDIRMTETSTAEAQIERRYRGVIDMTPAREQLGYKPSTVSLLDGLAEYAERYRQFTAAH